MTPSAQEIADEMQANIDPAATISGTIKVDMGSEGAIFIDGRTAPATVKVDASAADCTLICSAETFLGLVDGSIDGMKAYMSGKLKINGRDSLADEMDKLFKS
jgi:putative sterol carrier protein